MIKRVSITGPESTGKSELARNLAQAYKTKWVPEYARVYLNELEREYSREDLVYIAKGQLLKEEESLQSADRLLLCDTDMIVIKIWSEFKYGICDRWIKNKVQDHLYDLYLLCDIDLEWKDDPLREHPDRREELFNLYIRELEKIAAPYRIISGRGNVRLENAITAITEELGLIP